MKGHPPGRIVGVVLLVAVTAAVVVLAAAHGRIRTGRAELRPPDPPPAVTACLDQSREVVDCAAPHRWEVVAAWAADDPRRLVEPTTDLCARRAAGYGGIAQAGVLDGWTVRTTVVSAVLDAPADRSAGPHRGWTACGVQPAWVDQRSGSIATARTIAQAPDLFALCLDYLSNTGGADCTQPHDVQVLGAWNDAALEPALRAGALTVDQLPVAVRTGAAQACLTLGAGMTGASDPTYGGRLEYRIVLQQDGSGQVRLNCLVTPTGGRVLVGSVTALGDRPPPLR